MDPMQVLLQALALAGTTLQPIADDAVKDAYQGLKTLIVTRFGPKKPSLERAIEVHAEDPETFAPAVEQALREVGADQDQEVMSKAVELLQQAERVQPGVTGGLIQHADRIVNISGGFSGELNMGDTIHR
jgi:hypothetical protein